MSKAGLFSAVVTTFVAQTYQNLQVDYAAMSASLLYESVLVQRAIANGSSVSSIASSPLNPTITFVPATTDVWVNGLWFTSLFLSLTTALVAVLVKQWLHHYVALPSGTPRDRSLTRQFRYAGFQKWHVHVLMHLALAIFLSGLVVFLHPLQVALSWVICAGTGLVYTAYAVATILPILFPHCPYCTPLCDLVYVSFCRIIPRVTWSQSRKKEFLSSLRERDFNAMFRYRPRVQARTPHSLSTIESKFVQQTSTNLAPEALHWLLPVSSNPSVQSIVMQSIGGLPMASEGMFRALQDDTEAVGTLHSALLHQCLQWKNDAPCMEPVPGMELRLERLLRVYRRDRHGFYRISPNTDSFELAVAISFNDSLIDKNGAFVPPDELLMNIISGSVPTSKLPPHCWFYLARRAAQSAFKPLDPDEDDHANMFPLNLCSAILYSVDASLKGPTQDFHSPLVLDFKDALPYFLDEISHDVLRMFYPFVKHPSLSEPSLPQSLKVIVAAIKFLLHRLSLPESNMSHTIILRSLFFAIQWIPGQTFSSQEATALIMVLEDIIAPRAGPPPNIESDYSDLCRYSIFAYQSLTTIAPSACSPRGLQSMVDFMISHWDQTTGFFSQSDTACEALTDLLVRHIPVVFTVFHESQCLQFLGSHPFHEESVPMVSAYVAGIFAMQQGSDGAADAKSLQQHIEYLHNPHNLFAACSVLATHGVRRIDRTTIHRDITTLVQLRPQDAAWDECHRKLCDLVQGDDGNFFSKQRICTTSDWRFRPLQTDEIQVEKDNIRYAIHVLDGFFDGGVHTMVSRHHFLC